MKANKASTIAALAVAASTPDMRAGVRDLLRTKPAPAKPAPAKPVEIPAASQAMFNELKPSFAADTRNWLIGAKTGAQVFAARIAEPRIIAACLLNKKESLPLTKEGDVDRDALKAMRVSFAKLTPENKAKWEAKALPLFKSALKDYHAATKPLKKAVFDSKDFGLRSLRITLAKSGNIAVTSRHVHSVNK